MVIVMYQGTRSGCDGCMMSRRAAQRPETVRAKACVCTPKIITGEVEMLPAERVEAGQ